MGSGSTGVVEDGVGNCSTLGCSALDDGGFGSDLAVFFGGFFFSFSSYTLPSDIAPSDASDPEPSEVSRFRLRDEIGSCFAAVVPATFGGLRRSIKVFSNFKHRLLLRISVSCFRMSARISAMASDN